MDKASAIWKRQRANRRSSAANRLLYPTDRPVFPGRSGDQRCCWLAQQPARRAWWKRHVRQSSVCRTAIGRFGRGGRKVDRNHRRLRRVRRIANGAGTFARKSSGRCLPHRLWAYATTTATPKNTVPTAGSTPGQPPLPPQRLRRVSCGTTVDAPTDDGHYPGKSIMPGFHLDERIAFAVRTANSTGDAGKRYPSRP